jgi:ribosomal-protein-alanine N-acetyltransferase
MTLDCRIRLASRADSERIAELHALAFQKGWTASSISTFLTDPACAGFVAERQDTEPSALAGFVLVREAAGEAEILTLAVDPRWRGQGAGRRLVQAAIGWAASRGAETMFLEVGETNAAALAVYRHHGFVAVGHRRDYYASGGGKAENALVLKFKITS